MTFSQHGGIKGQVLDAEYNDQPLAFAEVKVQGLDIAVITDETGSFELDLAPGSYTLIVDFIGYEPLLIEEVEMGTQDLELDPVVLQSRKYRREAGIALSDNVLPSIED